jgi:hypothetical protein
LKPDADVDQTRREALGDISHYPGLQSEVVTFRVTAPAKA